MKIESFDVRSILVPMKPHRTASGVVTASPLVLLSVHTDEGLVGSSVIFTYTPAAQRPCAELMRNCEALVVGQDLAPAAVFDSLKYYGGIGFDRVLKTARAAESWAKAGAKGVKAKIGYPELRDDIAVVRAMRSAVGPDVAIMVDYNQSLDVAEAERRVRALDAEGLEWIEEPVLAHDFGALARLAAVTATPMQAGENWWGALDFRHALESGVSELMMLDVMKCGGVTGWMRIAAMAHVRSIPVSNPCGRR
ncbi:MAG: enolase C-terminal domain-like protein [Pseudomonadota bacterium]